ASADPSVPGNQSGSEHVETLPSPHEKAIPSTVLPGVSSPPGYEILGRLGQGGMGVVYKARQTGLKRIVALKMILAGVHADERQRARFRKEAEAIAGLRHDNIVQVFEVGDLDGHLYFSLEYCEEGSLDGLLKSGPMSSKAAAELVEQLARGMHHA